jgi:hypothetical protein
MDDGEGQNPGGTRQCVSAQGTRRPCALWERLYLGATRPSVIASRCFVAAKQSPKYRRRLLRRKERSSQ